MRDNTPKRYLKQEETTESSAQEEHDETRIRAISENMIRGIKEGIKLALRRSERMKTFVNKS